LTIIGGGGGGEGCDGSESGGSDGGEGRGPGSGSGATVVMPMIGRNLTSAAVAPPVLSTARNAKKMLSRWRRPVPTAGERFFEFLRAALRRRTIEKTHALSSFCRFFLS
jgi:hypothetical protein